jgi:uncharacterized protein
MGGFLALATAARRADVRCVASVAGVNFGLLGKRAFETPKARAEMAQLFADATTGPIRGTSGDALADELVANRDAFDLVRGAPHLAGRPVLLVAGSRDALVPFAEHHDPLAQALRAARARSLTTWTLDADHAFSSARVELTRMVIDWLRDRCYAVSPS